MPTSIEIKFATESMLNISCLQLLQIYFHYTYS